jgi:hypothetical protein
LARGHCDRPSGKLIRVAGTFAPADCHSIPMMPQGRMLKRDCGS